MSQISKYLKLVEAKLEQELQDALKQDEQDNKDMFSEGTVQNLAVVFFLRKIKTQYKRVQSSQSVEDKLDNLAGMLLTHSAITTLNSEDAGSLTGRLKQFVSALN